jgi:hypothetical protein
MIARLTAQFLLRLKILYAGMSELPEQPRWPAHVNKALAAYIGMRYGSW